jgi:hypothetical protein
MKIRSGSRVVPFVWTDRHDKVDSHHFSQSCERAYKQSCLSAHSIKPALKAFFRVASRSKLTIFYLKSDFNTFPVTEDMKGGPNDCTKKFMVLR